jgi:hypothetical protein
MPMFAYEPHQDRQLSEAYVVQPMHVLEGNHRRHLLLQKPRYVIVDW